MVFSGGPGKRPRGVQTRLGITGIFSILHVDETSISTSYFSEFTFILTFLRCKHSRTSCERLPKKRRVGGRLRGSRGWSCTIIG